MELFPSRNTEARRRPTFRRLLAVTTLLLTSCGASRIAENAEIVSCEGGAAVFSEKASDRTVEDIDTKLDQATAMVETLHRRTQETDGGIALSATSGTPKRLASDDSTLYVYYESSGEWATGAEDWVKFNFTNGNPGEISPGAIVCTDSTGIHTNKTFAGLESAVKQTDALG